MKTYFKNKKILITGNTGFKGSWLSLWMYMYGAKILGISSNIPTTPSNFHALNLKKKITFKKIDLRDSKKIIKEIKKFQPDYIFHLAAEAIVKRAYENPKYTWETNTFGTINILEALNSLKKKVVAIIITSDKVYKNLEINRGYKESDILGGLDPYSASKAAADLSVQSYFQTIFKKKKNIRICIARAGNVIGGGDWSEGRLVPDCIKKWAAKKVVKIRNPKSTRPWQHVLDVLNGYIKLAIKLNNNNKINGHAFNFGPKSEKNREVINVVNSMSNRWSKSQWIVKKDFNLKESNLLQLNSKKAKKFINWECKLNLYQSIKLTTDWYQVFYKDKKKILPLSIKQIEKFDKLNFKS